MISRGLIFLFFVIILLILLIAFMIHKYGLEKFQQKEPDSICAFDIDGTITRGINRAARAIAKCKELGAVIAINTARPSKWYDDLDIHALGLAGSDFESNFYHGEPFRCSFTDINCFEDSIASTKVKHLYELSSKWNVVPKRIILFDDQWNNINKAKQAGFSTIQANNPYGGLPENVVDQIDHILSN